MTPSQLLTFKNAILAEPALTADVAAGNHGVIEAFYNALASPAVSLWRPNVTVMELNKAIVWSAFVTLTAIRQNGYLAIIQAPLIDTTDAEIRAGFQAIFGAGATLNNLSAVAQRQATHFEALFLTASGAANISAVFGQRVTVADVAQAIGEV